MHSFRLNCAAIPLIKSHGDGPCGSVNSDFILSLFDEDTNKAVEMFKEFHENIINDEFLDVEKKKTIKDTEAIEIIKRTCGVNHGSDIQKLGKEQRNICLRILRNNGLSTRQISRLTGVSRNIVLKS